jgi:dihydrolipoamide dehydrogenase
MLGTLKELRSRYIEGRPPSCPPGGSRVESSGQSRELEAGKLILATGSESIQIAQHSLRRPDGHQQQRGPGSLPQIPKSMLIVGGGVIGCEMACAYAAFGTKVTIVEALERLLPMEDSWVSRLLEREFKHQGIEFHHRTQGDGRG